jgi:hypothetical protein
MHLHKAFRVPDLAPGVDHRLVLREPIVAPHTNEVVQLHLLVKLLVNGGRPTSIGHFCGCRCLVMVGLGWREMAIADRRLVIGIVLVLMRRLCLMMMMMLLLILLLLLLITLVVGGDRVGALLARYLIGVIVQRVLLAVLEHCGRCSGGGDTQSADQSSNKKGPNICGEKL